MFIHRHEDMEKFLKAAEELKKVHGDNEATNKWKEKYAEHRDEKDKSTFRF